MIGGGAAGLVAARLLAPRHRVVLFEREQTCGGNARSVAIGGGRSADLGVNVFHRGAYPTFFRLIERLGLETRPCELSITVGVDGRRVAGFDFNRQRPMVLAGGARPVAAPRGLGPLLALSERLLRRRPALTFGRLLDALPVDGDLKTSARALAAGVWTMRSEDVDRFPAGFVLSNLRRLDLWPGGGRGRWRRLADGVGTYLKALAAGPPFEVRTGAAVEAVSRRPGGVEVATTDGLSERFGAAVFATPGDVVGRLLRDPLPIESHVFARFKSIRHPIEFVRDRPSAESGTSLEVFMSDRPGAGPGSDLSLDAAVTDLHRLTCGAVPPGCAIRSAGMGGGGRVRHVWQGVTPSFCEAAAEARGWYDRVNGRDRIFFCGSYWGNGLHEDAIASAFRAAGRLENRPEPRP